MEKFNVEKKDYVFVVAPVVEDVAIEFGVNDPETITRNLQESPLL